ncbi:hypothetical protein Tco_0911368 [Tanacetum coccineum]|uniref:ANTAR domain-containing protein n=1 Tax=Tanacetum coccineum TaxID=301880 RepID=A0ABQ5CYR3_9ASTR
MRRVGAFVPMETEIRREVHELAAGIVLVSTKMELTSDIYILVEKEYPLSRGVLIQMLEAKLLVEQNNEMSRELLRKIFMMAERPRR